MTTDLPTYSEVIDHLEPLVFSDQATDLQIEQYWVAVREVCIARGNHLSQLVSSGGNDICFECGSAN